MIGFLRGRIHRADPDRVILDVGGVGYEVHVPVSTYYELEKAGDGEVSLSIHTHVREDALQLFGFWTHREKQLFLRLIAVSGIGPRLAQTILSGMPPSELVDALVQADLRRLNKIPGVGKKTAERMVLELRDKVRDLVGTEPGPAPARAQDDDLVAALANLGYKRADAEKAVARVERDSPDAPFADKLRLSLRILSKV